MTKVFYSWQSDTPAKVGKRFVGHAISAALELLKSEAEIDPAVRGSLHIDHDTLNVPGSPPIVDTILEKIDNASAFISDVTFVATRPNGKKTPNPNVCVEHGWALKSLTYNRVVSVLNTAYGHPDDNPLPFDLQHMLGPVMYELPETAPPAERKAIQARLAKGIAKRLKSIFTAAEADFLSEGEKFELAKGDAEAALFAYYDEPFYGRNPYIITRPKLMVRVVPILVRPAPKLDPKLVTRLRDSFALHPSDRVEVGCDAHQWWASDPLRKVERWPNPEAMWIMRLKQPGETEYQVNLRLFEGDYTPDTEFEIDGRHLEGKIMLAVDKMCKILTEVGFSGPALVGIAFDHVGGMRIGKARASGKKVVISHLHLPSVAINSLDSFDDAAFQPAFNHLWLQSGWPEGSPSFERGVWAGRANPRLYDID